ncbi:MAG: type II toxin-antitoxin system RelE/ParE family toxin [Nanobdellota archaeon]
MYDIIQTDYFESEFEKIIPDNLKERARKKIESLREKPKSGKPLSYEFLRELKIDKYRIYYMVYENILTILLVSTGDKKTQKLMIEEIKEKRESLKTFAHNYTNYLKEKGDHMYMDKEEKRLLKERNELLEKLVRSLEDVKEGRLKPFK